jgi:hypothetical protein
MTSRLRGLRLCALLLVLTPIGLVAQTSIVLHWTPGTNPAGYSVLDYCVVRGLSQADITWIQNPFEPFCGFRVPAGSTSWVDTNVGPAGNTTIFWYAVAAEYHLTNPGSGTVSVTNGSATVTSVSGSGFATNGSWVGKPIALGGSAGIVDGSGNSLGGLYKVLSVTDASHLVLSHTYAASSGTLSYGLDDILISPESNFTSCSLSGPCSGTQGSRPAAPTGVSVTVQ